jgi:hypothetical protein
MTVSTTVVPDYQRDQILTAAIRLAGLLADGDGQEASAEQIASAAVHLNLALEELQSEGIVLTSVERTTLSLVADTASYDLPADTLDVVVEHGDVVGMIVPASGSELPVRAMPRSRWLKLPDKTDTTGTPSLAYVERLTASVTVTFWPVPDDSTATFRYGKVRLLKGGNSGAVTTDLQRTWLPWLTYATAVGVALDSSQTQKATLLKKLADQKLAKARLTNVEHGTLQLSAGHSGRNW